MIGNKVPSDLYMTKSEPSELKLEQASLEDIVGWVLKDLKIISFYSNEKQLIKNSVSGDREAQKRLYEKHAPKMLSVCRQYIKDLHFAEDVMINGFVKVFKHLDSFRFEGSFEGWIRRIMVRESITHLRKQQFVVFDDTIFERTPSPSITTSSELDVAHIQS